MTRDLCRIRFFEPPIGGTTIMPPGKKPVEPQAEELGKAYLQPGRSRKPSAKGATVGQARAVLDCKARFLSGVDEKLRVD